jgi:hypothetical protein
MSDQVYNSRPIALMGIPKNPSRVPDNIIIINTTLEALKGSGDHIVADDVVETQQTHAATLLTKQEAMKGGPADKTEQRNMAYEICFKDRQSDLLSVQQAADALPDFNAAAALIKRNGFEVKKEHAPLLSNDISIKRKKDAETTIIAEVKAPKTRKRFAIEWDYSYDNGLTWNHLYPTAVCSREITGLESLKKVIIRARFIIGDNAPMDWMISNSIDL